MPDFARLDVLIVYNGCTASSASDPSVPRPFTQASQNESCNASYLYMLLYCKRLKLSAGFTTSSDIIGPGRCSSYWVIKNNTWAKVLAPAYSRQIFDKFSPKNAQDRIIRELLFSSSVVLPYNTKKIFNMFFDKQSTYNHHLDSSIPTVSLESRSLTQIKAKCLRLASLMDSCHKGDFTTDLIMKDRYGAGGWHVYKIRPNNYKQIEHIMRKYPAISFILQPFMVFDARDTRLIYLGGKLIQSYYRQAKSGDFRCNEHQGGSSTYTTLSQIPREIRDKADVIVANLNHVSSLYALDFITGSSGKVYFIEGNTGPGLSWNADLKKEVFMGKQLIRAIVKNIIKRLKISRSPLPSLRSHLSSSRVEPQASEIPYQVLAL